MIRHIKNILSSFFLLLIVLYKKFISPFLPHACRYTPTCSEYMFQAIKIHGLFTGIYLGIRRIMRCNPWGGSGFDPVPLKNDKTEYNKDTD